MKNRKLTEKEILERVQMEFDALHKLFQFFTQRAPTAVCRWGEYKDGSSYILAVFKPNLPPNQKFLNSLMKWKHFVDKTTEKAVKQLSGGNVQMWDQTVDSG